jgi:hypothetical protein
MIDPLIVDSSIPETIPIKMATRIKERKASSLTTVVRSTSSKIPINRSTIGIKKGLFSVENRY